MNMRAIIAGLSLLVIGGLVGCGAIQLGAPDNGSPVQPVRRPTTRPEAGDAAADLVRAVALVGNLDYAKASPLLASLEGRLLLARDLPRAAEAAFWAAFCDEKLGQPDRALTGYHRLIDRYPQTPHARTAAERSVRLTPPPPTSPAAPKP